MVNTILACSIRPSLYDIGLLFILDRFPESGTKTLWSISIYTKPGKQPNDTISCRKNFIMSAIFVVFFAYLPSSQSINLICIEAILLSELGLGAFRIGSQCLHVKQNGTDCTGSFLVPPADAEQHCMGLLE